MRRVSKVIGLGAAVAVLASSVVAGTGSAAPEPGTRTETVINSVHPDPDVVKTLVKIYSPLPSSVGPRPAECDYARYVRYRHRNGPVSSADADSIMSLVPGAAGGADENEPTARSTITGAAARGRYVEYWVMAYRSECLNDRTGLDAAVRAKDYRVALDYYYRGKPVDGKTFAGWPSWRDESFLAKVGVGQAMNDWRTIITDAVPDPAQRARLVFCGGHSLGGPTTGALSAWDFDGNPDTTADAGYNLCAGWVALDSYLVSDPAGISRFPILGTFANGLASLPSQFVEALGQLGIHPSIDLKVVMTAEMLNMMAIIGMAAHFEPDAESTLLREFPRGVNIDLTLRAFLARSWTQFVTNVPPVRSFRYTNEALLGALWDDNSMPVALGGLGLGSLTGGPLGAKTFVLPEAVNGVPILGPIIKGTVTGEHKVGPMDPTRLYTWHNYDEPAQRRWDGKVFSTPAEEMTDIRDFAPMLFEGPTSYLDTYFSTTQITDTLFLAGARNGELRNVVHPEGAKLRPRLVVHATDGPLRWVGTVFDPVLSFLNPDAPPLTPADVVLAPGYQHQDVIGAARKQNNNRPEVVSTALIDFMEPA